jgi:CheY-like chemotaxis protein
VAKILVVDDNATNRKQVVALLSYDGHVTLEAHDGVDGLEMARAERPQLVIADILMPSMDGFSFVRQLRSDQELRGTPVIFHTAHHHEREARKLAEACHVSRVLVKPCPAADMLQAVEQVLAGVLESDTHTLSDSFDHESLRLVTNKLSAKADALAASNARFAAFTEFNVQLTSERDPRALLERVCAGARNLLGSRYAVLAVKGNDCGPFFAISGIDFKGKPPTPPELDAGPLGEVVTEGRPWRISSPDNHGISAGLPDSYPPASAFLAAPLTSQTCTYGWLCLADKIGADAFDAEDERLLVALGAQVGHLYENSSLYLEVHQREERFRELAEVRMRLLTRVRSELSGINSLIVRAHARGAEERAFLDEAEMERLGELAKSVSLALDHTESVAHMPRGPATR